MIVIANSSPLIVLGRLEELGIFKQLFGKISIPFTVYKETVLEATHKGQKRAISLAIEAGFIEVVRPQVKYSFTRKLHLGEQDVLNLALDIHADLLILDDRKARNEAKEFGFEVAYTSAIIHGAERRGLINSSATLLKDLRNMHIYLPEE
jgi:predicted nucleic acid-binding protein